MAVKEVDLDKILDEIGELGKHNRKIYCLLSLVIMYAAICNTNYIFAADDDTYRCVVPECDTADSPIEADWLNYTMASNAKFRRCNRYAPINSSLPDQATCSPENFDSNTTIDCEKWVFGKGKTVIKEFGIQCHNTKRVTIFTVQNVGLFVALLVVAFLSDGFGRRLAIVVSALLTGILGLIRSFSANYIMFVVFQGLEPTLGSGLFGASFILGIEMVGPKRRVLIATILCMSYSFGAVILGGISWFLAYWRHLLWVIYCPSILFLSYYWFVDESVRWLISDGQFERAVRLLKKSAATNRVILSEKSMENLYHNVMTSQADLEIKTDSEREADELDTDVEAEIIAEPENKDSMFVQALKSRRVLIRILVITFWWVTCTITYYGICKNAVPLFDNVHLNFMVVSSIDIPAYFTMFLVLDRCGRKPTLVVAFIASGVVCVVLPLLPADPRWIQLTTYILGRYFISLEFGSLYIYTSEIFPTLLRQSSLGPPLAPQTPFLTDVYVPGIDTYIFGGLSFTSALLLLTSPETTLTRYPSTMKETEDVGRKKTPKIN